MSGRGVTKFVTGVTLKVRWAVLLLRGAGIERKPLQENGSPGGRRRRRIPGRGTCRENQSPGGPGSSRQSINVGGRGAVATRPPGAMLLSGCLRQAYAGRSVVVRAADNGAFGRLGTARWRRLQGQQEKPLKTAGCSILPPLPPHPLTKIVTPTGTLPTNCQRRVGGHGGGTGPIRTGKKRILCRTTGYKNPCELARKLLKGWQSLIGRCPLHHPISWRKRT